VTAPATVSHEPAPAPLLFDGKGFEEWKGADNWKADDDGGFTVKGASQTKQEFGDCQLHLNSRHRSP